MSTRAPLGRHIPFYIGAAGGLACGAVALLLVPELAATAAANAFFIVYLALTLAGLPGMTADYLRDNAAATDAPVWLIFLVTAATVATAVVSLFLLVNAAGRPPVLHLVLSLAAVPLGWLTIHMMAAIHYAHLFWQPDGAPAGETRRGHRAGLSFPGTERPRGADFVYFSYVLGMTSQTSDVVIQTRAMRNVAIVHAIVAFFFNTVLVAAAVNLAVSIGN